VTFLQVQERQQGGNSPDLLADQSPDGMQLPAQLPPQWAAAPAFGETPLRALQGTSQILYLLAKTPRNRARLLLIFAQSQVASVAKALMRAS
jgi:hypothetical protein